MRKHFATIKDEKIYVQKNKNKNKTKKVACFMEITITCN